jgi:hypothetical protein|tara:strand:+ start:489 stop:725 length:237 start_codon:yes stop_codon:yes gene_type:complete
MNERYVIIQYEIAQNKKGDVSATEVVLAYPDTFANAKSRLFKWQNILDIKGIRMRRATMNDYPKTKKQKRREKTCASH